MRFILRVEWQTSPVRVLCLQKSMKGKVREDEVHQCFIKFIRSLSVPSALWQQGQFGVWENSGKTRASLIFMLRTIDHKPSVWGDFHAGGFLCHRERSSLWHKNVQLHNAPLEHCYACIGTRRCDWCAGEDASWRLRAPARKESQSDSLFCRILEHYYE